METNQVIDRFVEKAGSGHAGHADFLGQPPAERRVVFHPEAGKVDQHIVGPLRLGVGQTDFIQVM